jgi:hypothetical protein
MFIDLSALIAHNPPMLGYGVAVADLHGNGTHIFVVAGFGCDNRLLAWDGGRLVDGIDRLLASPQRQSIGVAAADIDGDGREEIYVLNTDTFAGAKSYGDNLFTSRHGTWTDVFAFPENERVGNRVAGRSVCAIDRYGHGRYGFAVASYGGPIRLYECRQTRDQLYDAAPDARIDMVAGGRSVVALPLVSAPGRIDLFFANENGPNFLFASDGEGAFEDVAEAMGVADELEHGRGVAVLDADGNGRFDLAIGNWQGENRLFLQSPMGGFLDAASPDLARPSAVRTVIAADFDNDGYEEIFFNNFGEPNRLFGWREGVWTRLPMGAAAEPEALGTGAAVADIDDDGRLELLVAHGESEPQPLSLYRADAKGNSWLRVQPLTPAGAPARGAVVTLCAPDRLQRRVIDGGSGYLCQMEPVAHFGLGSKPEVEWVEIVWPGGASGRIPVPAANQTLRVPHPPV